MYTLKKRAPIVLRITQACLLLLIVGSLQPARPAPVVGLHREIHWLAFAGATFLLLLLSRNRRQEIRRAIGVFLLGLSLEYLQHLIYRNPMEWRDVRDDTLAILAAFALYQLNLAARWWFHVPSLGGVTTSWVAMLHHLVQAGFHRHPWSADRGVLRSGPDWPAQSPPCSTAGCASNSITSSLSMTRSVPSKRARGQVLGSLTVHRPDQLE